MNRNLLARAIAIVLLGLLFAVYLNHDYAKWRRLGRDAFVAHEQERFDRFIAPVRPFGVLAVDGIVVSVLLFCLYQTIVGIASALLKPIIPEPEKGVGINNMPFS